MRGFDDHMDHHCLVIAKPDGRWPMFGGDLVLVEPVRREKYVADGDLVVD